MFGRQRSLRHRAHMFGGARVAETEPRDPSLAQRDLARPARRSRSSRHEHAHRARAQAHSARREGDDVSSEAKDIDALLAKSYRHGFVTDIDSDTLPPGLDEDVVRFISRKKKEPEFL